MTFKLGVFRFVRYFFFFSGMRVYGLPLARSNHHKSKMSHEPVVMEEPLPTRPHCDIIICSVSNLFLGRGLMNYLEIYLEEEIIVTI